MIKIEQVKVDISTNTIFLDGDKICSFRDDGRFFTSAKVITGEGWWISSFGRGLLELYSIEERTTIVLECFEDEVEVNIYEDC